MALRKKIGGKIYHFDAQFHNELRASSRARLLRRRGWRARVRRVDFMTWEVWCRKGA